MTIKSESPCEPVIKSETGSANVAGDEMYDDMMHK
jgi:hypothetical protein